MTARLLTNLPLAASEEFYWVLAGFISSGELTSSGFLKV